MKIFDDNPLALICKGIVGRIMLFLCVYVRIY